MDAKDQLLKSRADLAAVLDEKFKSVPEWRAYRAVEAALNAFLTGSESPAPRRSRSSEPSESHSYANLSLKAIDDAGRPLTTAEIVEFVSRHRDVPNDPQKAKLNIGSGLSRDERLRNIPWRGGKAWWRANQPLPDHQSAAE
jgi:hypothetical protein